jgi:hypothetical protein
MGFSWDLRSRMGMMVAFDGGFGHPGISPSFLWGDHGEKNWRSLTKHN